MFSILLCFDFNFYLNFIINTFTFNLSSILYKFLFLIIFFQLFFCICEAICPLIAIGHHRNVFDGKLSLRYENKKFTFDRHLVFRDIRTQFPLRQVLLEPSFHSGKRFITGLLRGCEKNFGHRDFEVSLCGKEAGL